MYTAFSKYIERNSYNFLPHNYFYNKVLKDEHEKLEILKYFYSF